MSFEVGQVVRERGAKRVFTVHAVPSAADGRLWLEDTTTGRLYGVDGSTFEVLPEPEPALEPEHKRRGRPPKAKP